MLDRLRIALERRLEKLTAGTSGPAPSSPGAAEAAALRAKGNEFLAAGDYVAAEDWFRKALEKRADDAPSLVCLGFALKEQGRLSEARVALRRAINLAHQAPDEYEMHYLLGQISEQQGDLADARKLYTEALRLKPDFSRACKDLCRVLTIDGEPQQIRATLEHYTLLSPQTAEYHLWLSDICINEMDFKGVADHLRTAIQLGVRTVEAHMTLGAALCRLGEVDEAARVMAVAQEMDPAVAFMVHYHIGYYHFRNGELRAGFEHMEKSIALRPDFLAAHSSLLLALSHANGELPISYREAAERFARAVTGGIKHPLPGRDDRGAIEANRADAKLRVGFVSGDLYRHPVAFFLEDVLRHVDRTKIHLVAYPNNPLSDDVTTSLQPLFDEWHSIRLLSDDDAAGIIASHHIDVLVDLSGHTGENRLAVFARRPAPTQVSWLGYFASTGLREMDYIVGDPVSTPVGSTEWFSEKVYRMSHTRLCMGTPNVARDIKVGPPPCLQRGYVTFGSYQQATKITPKVLAVWSQVLQAVPNSRLRLQTRAIDTPSMRDRLTRDMSSAGIDLARVQMLGASDLEHYLESHSEVDVLLDTFPYPGGTTTTFGLWMGVPTVTLAGNTMLSRQGACMLQCVDLADWVADSAAAYVDLCVRKTAAPHALAALRAGLRETALKSPLFDAARFALDFQAALLDMSRQAGS